MQFIVTAPKTNVLAFVMQLQQLLTKLLRKLSSNMSVEKKKL